MYIFRLRKGGREGLLGDGDVRKERWQVRIRRRRDKKEEIDLGAIIT